MKLIVTGGLSFIGKHFIKMTLEKGYEVINIDKKTYAADMDFFDNRGETRIPNYSLIEKDINDIKVIPNDIDFIINFAAESDVERSIGMDNKSFMETNVMGTRNLLELIRVKSRWDRPILIHTSSDEVLGDVVSGYLDENALLNPSNPYAASKASAEHLITSWSRTYGINYLILRPSNNYGNFQYPEKLIPRTVNRFKRGKKAIVVGDGTYKRTWTHVEYTGRAILFLMDKYNKNDIYHITSGYELSNIEVIKKIFDNCYWLKGERFEDWIEYVENRMGQDIRYGCSGNKLKELGFTYIKNFDEEIRNIVNAKEPDWRVV